MDGIPNIHAFETLTMWTIRKQQITKYYIRYLFISMPALKKRTLHEIEVKDIISYGRTYGWPVLWTTTAAPRTPCSHGCHTTARGPTGHGLWRTPCRTRNSHAGMSSHTPVHAPMANTLLIGLNKIWHLQQWLVGETGATLKTVVSHWLSGTGLHLR